ncbi:MULTISPECIES: hypothetical protein [unclassified Tolypothrix]|uniref:hypothetical protein n=1 Tax=unclassified Tolypothrix TaxID=2649714 RepID=UPI0005EAC77C|nr:MULTISPECIES: hypothetical protein [unclassified Tolypothrix]MBE9085297.1 hypothetical protein [Tolypothrix sp. LEGE 11397]BAY88910.1 hypothetical protein NIES3275_09100 [Microchaete diplosiphon NIES-3275]EKF03169.1 hypothetical protein FDUTEX481_05449 [Tolypothrix sp. PCC 7601]UYD29553.1 hypothetical protein HGR01_16920 [Tolypothrix sp. PCC 7712]UYD34534.1 hypothetical protein HG267_01375 [Tolypothrix sp. PCC 7601]
MPRERQKSRILEKAQLRTYGLNAIDPNIDFGENRNLEGMKELIEKLRNKMLAYNTALVTLNAYKSEIQDLEKILGDLCERMLLGVAFRYGKDSHEYELAGGVRTSKRVRKSTITRSKAVKEETPSGKTKKA